MLNLLLFREQQKRLSAVEMELAAARQAGFVSNKLVDKGDGHSKKRILAVIGIITTFGRKKNRDAIRKAWMPTGKIDCPYASLENCLCIWWWLLRQVLDFLTWQ